MTLPQCTVGWSAVCDCGISGSRLLPFYVESKYIFNFVNRGSYISAHFLLN